MSIFRRSAILLIIFALLVLFVPEAFAAGIPQLSAEAVVLADMDSGVVLYEKNMDQMRSPASLTKIMTGLLAVEAVENGEISLEEIVTAPADCWSGMDLDSSNAEIMPGEKMTFKDYLYCAMVKSANEACNVIATAVDGSIQSFVNRMNLRANELGATHTYFSDTNGLSNDNHYTTAHDLFIITREAMKHEIFVDAVNTIDYEIEETNMHAKRYLNSSNALLCQDGLYGDGYLYLPASGVKTGYTERAGYCLVSTAQKKDMNLCVVVLGCGGVLNTGMDGYGNFSDTIKLYDWAFSNCEKSILIGKGDIVNRAPVQFGKDNATVGLRATETLEVVLPKDIDRDRIQVRISTYKDRLTAPIVEGTILGKAGVYIDGNLLGEVNLFNSEPVQADPKQVAAQRLKEILANRQFRMSVIVSVVLIVLIVSILSGYYKQKKKHLQEVAAAEDRRRSEYARLKKEEENNTDNGRTS